jgi:hypothetical protein
MIARSIASRRKNMDVRVRTGIVVGALAALAIAGSGAAAEAVAMLPTEHSGTIVQVAPITVGTSFPTSAPTSRPRNASGSATPVRAAGPRDVDPGHDFGEAGSHTPDGSGTGFHHGPGHGGQGGIGRHHGGPVHTVYPSSP